VRAQIASAAATRPDTPPLPRIGREFALKGEPVSAPWSARRERYPCTHCQSTEHIDPQCPKRPPRNKNWNPRPDVTATARATVLAFLIQDSDVPDDEYLTAVDVDTFYCYQEMITDLNVNTGTPLSDTPDSSPVPGKEESSH
jgi:hypothetical protein